MQTVKRRSWATQPDHQIARVRSSKPRFSHDKQIPLVISVKRNGWFGRKVLVTTVEPLFYVDALVSIEVPPHFSCDLASIPRLLWCLASPYDLALEAIFHDRLYREQEVARQVADFLMLHMMELRGVPWWVRYPVWIAVRLFGGKAWKRNAEANKAI